ncbi:probable ADP-ribosylation factor GTPase-activating protein AGD14 [Cynara cardunculus var. scolymus]|uniref:probable ADP-ribosylation factor GTPase-activating protein AGD14 n=1 Tax=Cynara cardunculus var. scolymus TaxID=59895 RepID=UPI000D62B246|nr:probable ADP-ribosylation factor GTPase-activating protein AGD14 [Cynara cardunculus var. scolymus]
MPSCMKEDERIENIIRGLLKLSQNRRCINCNSLGPQYVCTTFWTFVCTNCSGVHREFSHRVKSVSMAKFSAEEVRSLEDGGNKRAREIYFKTWDPQINSSPDGSNLMKLRNFIKHVYIERRFTGEKSSDKLAFLKMELKDGFFEKSSYGRCSTGRRDEYYKKHSSIRSYSRGGHEPRSVMNSVEGKSPWYQENGTPCARRTRSCARFDIIDDRFRDNDYGKVTMHERHRFTGSLQRGVSLSPDILTSTETTPWEKVAETSSPASTNGKQEVQKIERSNSMIDTKVKADAAPESSNASVSSNRYEVVQSSNRGNSLFFSSTQQRSPEKASKPPSVNFVEVLLLELASPVVVPVGSTSEVPSSVDALSTTPATLSNGVNTSATASNMGLLALPSSGGDSLDEVANGKHLLETKQHQPSASSTVDSSSTDRQSSLPIETSSNKNLCPSAAQNLQPQVLSYQLSWPSPALTSQAQTSPNQHSWPSPESNYQSASNSQPAPNSEASISSNSSSGQFSHVADKLPLDNNLADASIPAARKELPADIFTSPYSLYPASVPYGQFHPAQQMWMGMGMHYHPSPVVSQPSYY